MKLFTVFFIFYLFILAAQAKGVQKIWKLSNFNKQGPFIFLTKFHIGAGYGQMDMTYRKGEEIILEEFYNDAAIGMVNSTVYKQFSKASTCQDKAKFIYKKQKLSFKQERYGMKHVKLFDLAEEQLWYFYIYSCLQNLEVLNQSIEQVDFTFAVTNNGSQFGQNDQILAAYIILVVVWCILIAKFALPMGTLITFKKPDALKLSIFGGLLILGMGYLYKLIHLIFYNFDGIGINVFQILYIVLKHIGEAIITTMIVSLSWGWSILHLKSGLFYLIIGIVTGLINIVSLALSSLTEQHEQLYHHYQTTPGLIVLVLRVILFIVFMSGICHCLSQSSTKIVYFIKKLAIVGSLYLLSWPVTVFIVQFTFPSYMHREIITFVEEIVHICACTFLCSMISHPESAYRKVSLQDDDNPFKINDYRRK